MVVALILVLVLLVLLVFTLEYSNELKYANELEYAITEIAARNEQIKSLEHQVHLLERDLEVEKMS